MSYLSNIKIKATGNVKKDKQGKEYDHAVLCIEDNNSTLFEITGLSFKNGDEYGQWTVRRIFH